MKRNHTMYNGRVDPSRFYQKLWEEKFLPENISEMEELRWQKVLRYQEMLNTKWKSIFDNIPSGGTFFGIHRRWVKDHYQDEFVVFDYEDHGISNSFPTESSDQKKFVRCLDTNKLPLYINSSDDTTRELIKKRMEGDKELTQFPKCQDLVDLYYRTEVEGGRLLAAIGFYEQIINDHYGNMVRRMVRDMRFKEPVVVLSINNRLYVYQDGALSIRPEDNYYVFFESDLSNKEKIDGLYQHTHQLAVSERREDAKYK